MDLRGHGLSEKPEPDAAYKSERWADDIRAVIDSLNLINPVLVGWSYGGLVILDYIAQYGDEQISGINLVASFSKFGVPDSPLLPADRDIPPEIGSDHAFTRRLFYRDPSPRDYYFLAMTLIAESEPMAGAMDHDDLLPEIEVPALITHGREEAVVAVDAAKNLTENIRDARASYYPDVGHMPFWEAPKRFNRELRRFVQKSAVYR